MKYYLIETITFNDETKDSVSIYTKETERDAKSTAYKELGAWMVKENVQTVNVIVKNERGFIFLNEEDSKPIIETEVTEEEVGE